MSFKSTLLAAAAACTLAFPALADGPITIEDAYARTSMPGAPSGAAFMTIRNAGDAADRLIGVVSEVAERVELHTHIADSNGVMQMREVEEGFEIPARGAHMLERGGDHVMFMGLRQSLAQGDVVEVTLEFEKAGKMAVEIPVDLERQPDHGMKH